MQRNRLLLAKGELEIPGFLFAQSGGAKARLNRNGRLGAFVPGGSEGRFERLALAPGRWQATLHASDSVELSVDGGPWLRGAGQFIVNDVSPVTLAVRSDHATVI